MTVNQAPETYNFAGNLPDIIISSPFEVQCEIQRDGVLILTENYNPNLAGEITIEIRELIFGLLASSLPDDNLFEQSEGASQFTLTLTDDVNDPIDINFHAIAGGIRPIGSTYLTTNFLTWQERTKYIKEEDPEYLTFFTTQASSVRILATLDDNTTEEVDYQTLETEKLYTFDVSFQTVSDLFQGDVRKYQVYIVPSAQELNGLSSTKLSNVQEFILSTEYFESRDLFIFQNSLGGIDTVSFTGGLEQVENFEINKATFGRIDVEYDSESKRRFLKNTGSFRSKWQTRWARDFFASIQKWWFKNDEFQKILTNSNDLTSVLNNLNSYQFEFEEEEKHLFQIYEDFFPPGSSSPPENLSAAAISESEIALSWDQYSGQANSLIVEYSTTEDFSGTITTIPDIPTSSTALSLDSLSDGTKYFIRIKSNTSQYSATIQATTFLNFGNALRFDNVNDFVDLSVLDGVAIPSELTLAFWFKNVETKDTSQTTTFLWCADINTGNQSELFQVRFNIDDNELKIRLDHLNVGGASPTGPGWLLSSFAGDLFDGNWHRLVFTREDFDATYDKWRAYIDAQVVLSGSNEFALADKSLCPLTFQPYTEISFNRFAFLGGEIDEFIFVNQRISDELVQDDYNNGNGSRQLESISRTFHYKMDESIGSTANDSSGNNYHGTLTNFTTVDEDKWVTH